MVPLCYGRSSNLMNIFGENSCRSFFFCYFFYYPVHNSWNAHYKNSSLAECTAKGCGQRILLFPSSIFPYLLIPLCKRNKLCGENGSNIVTLNVSSQLKYLKNVLNEIKEKKYRAVMSNNFGAWPNWNWQWTVSVFLWVFFFFFSFLWRVTLTVQKDLLIQNLNARHPEQQGIWLFHTHNTYTHASQ